MTDDARAAAAALVERSRTAAARERFEARVRDQADALAAGIDAGAFDSAAPTLGLELEVYAVDDAGRPAPLPEAVFEGPAAKELGVHNAELNADPTRFSPGGVAAQERALGSALAETRERAAGAGLDVVLDGMWATAPAAGTVPYLDAVTDRDGVCIAEHMRADPRYYALDNAALDRAGGEISLSVPGADLTFHTILFESLATSIQPHVLVPDAAALPRYHNLAVRTLGPLLALSTNSPFLPADCYGDADPDALVERTHHELRVAAFEQSMNQGCRKVCVPADLDGPADAVEQVAADDAFAPFLREWLDDTDPPDPATAATADPPPADLMDAFWEFDYKRGTFWRWVRAVPGGTAVGGACDPRSLRLEYRPLPTQPTVRDVVALQVLTAGLLHGLVVTDHPLHELPRDAAEESFYAAVEDGLDADLAWVRADGERTGDADEVFAEVFDLAREGLADCGFDADARDRYLAPIEARWEAGVTPSVWKKRRVREALDGGAALGAALAEMQREYVERSRESGTFADWL